MADPTKIRASRAGQARALDARRTRRNSAKILADLELGAGLEIDSRGRLAVVGFGSAESAQANTLPDLSDVRPLQDQGGVAPAPSNILDPITEITDTPANADALRDELESEQFAVVRENFATLVRQMNLILERLQS